MKQLTSIDSNFNFKGNQIVCLEHDQSFLYAEVIQVIETRQTCWVRPWLLKILSSANNQFSNLPEKETIFDLRESSDLVLPISLFRLALDTEVIPLLSELDTLKTQRARFDNCSQTTAAICRNCLASLQIFFFSNR